MLLEVALIIVTCFLVVKLFRVQGRPPGTPPGSRGWPIIGAIPSRKESIEQFLNTCRQKYGDIFWLKVGSYNNIYLNRLEDITAAFNNPSLQGRPNFFSVQLRYKYGETDSQRQKIFMKDISGIIFSEGDRWRNVRRFAIRRLKDGGMGKSSSMEGIILREAQFLVEDFEKYAGKSTEIPWSVNAAILNVVWELVGAQRYDVYDKKLQTLLSDLNDILAITQDGLFLFDMIPAMAQYTPNFITNYFGKKEFEKKIKRIYNQMHDAINHHKGTLDMNNPRDLIDFYLIDMQLAKEDSPNKTDYSTTFSERELAQTLFDLFAAGSETTSSTVKWFIFYMAKYGEIQKKVQDEIDNIISKEGTVSFDDREKLPFLECCISETLRLKSVLPFGGPHVATEDTTIGDYVIPKGDIVKANIMACHRDPKFWKKPYEFYPEHFLNDDGTFNSKKEGLIPFSTGRRVCLGENLAKMDLFLMLTMLLKNFSFTVPEGQMMSDEPLQVQPLFALPFNFKIIINKRE